MESLVTSGALLDLVLLVVALEVIALALLGNRFPRLPPLTHLLPNIVAGAALMVCLRLSLTEADWRWTPLLLTAALAAHLTDLWVRARSAAGKS